MPFTLKYTVHGSMCQTVKSKLLELFNRDPVRENKRPRHPCCRGADLEASDPTLEDREARKRDVSEYLWSD